MPASPPAQLRGYVRAVPATTGFVSSPIPEAETVTTSPGLRKAGGSMNVPQPRGVPVESTSPGRSVMMELSHSIATGGGPICSRTYASWRSSPLTYDCDADVLPVGKLVLRDDARPHRAERVEALSKVDLVVVELHGASADIVDHGVSEDVVERVLRPHVLGGLADHHAELDLVVDRKPVLAQRARGVAGHALDDVVVGRDDDVLARADDGGGQLGEIPAQLVGGNVVGILVAVARVVDARAEDRPRTNRMDDAVDLDRIARPSSCGALETSLPIPDQIEGVVVACGEDVVADLDATCHLRPREVLHDAHFSNSLAFGCLWRAIVQNCRVAAVRSGVLGGLACEPAGRALDVCCPVELRALDADTVRGRPRNERRDTASPGARDRGGAVGRQRLRAHDRIVDAEADVVDAFTVLRERAGDVALVIQRLHELDERISGVEVGEADARLGELFGVDDV